ncbi:hypothetical protein C0989_000247 [Termitomyces sp. Mn162]|nr:hypothetical protein C0989_000247 [Termitomyces sp. Mn162]
MHNNERFMTFIVQFGWEAYKTSWNYNALQFTLHRTLPQWIKDILHLAPKQITYDGYKALMTQVNQCYWEDCSENMAPQTLWNTSNQGVTSTNRPLGQHLPAQLNAVNLYETLEPLDTNPNDHNNILDPTNNQEALCTNSVQDSPWINVLEEMQEKQWKEGTCILCGLEDALDHRPDPNVFSALATLLCAMILALDSPPVHLPSHSSTNLLLNPIPTLVNSGATNNFINESLAALAPHPLQCLPTLILLKLFDGDPTRVGDITHCLETTMTFANGRQQEL